MILICTEEISSVGLSPMLTILRILHVGVQPVSVVRYLSELAHCVGHLGPLTVHVVVVSATAGTHQDVLPSLFARSELTFQLILATKIYFPKMLALKFSLLAGQRAT